MKFKKIIITLVIILIVIAGVNYSLVSLNNAASPPEPAKEPDMSQAPVRLYGRVEPHGREVFVGAQLPRLVTSIFVEEGQNVKKGQLLCKLESSVEEEAVKLSEDRAVLEDKKLELLIDELNRKAKLAPSGAVPAGHLSQKQLEAEVIRQQIKVAKAEVELRKKRLDRLSLTSPVDGILYKFDVRLGEQLIPEDYQRIIIGNKEKQVRLFIESFWIGSIALGDLFEVRDGETFEFLGDGRLTFLANYVGSRDFKTDDSLERLDTRYAQGVLKFNEEIDIPIGSLVLAIRKDSKVDTGRQENSQVNQGR